MINYELVLVLPGNLEKENLTSLNQSVKKIIETVGAKIIKEEDWGVKKMAYQIKKTDLGNYYFWNIELPKDKIKELNQLLNFETRILRYMLLKIAA